MTAPKDDNLALLMEQLEQHGIATGFLPTPRFNDKYILDGHTPVECPDLILWATWFEDTRKSRIVQQDQIGEYWVSTVFLGLDHGYGYLREGGPPKAYRPILFETMTFIGNPKNRKRDSRGKLRPDIESDGCDRYATWDEALAGHLVICERLRLGG
jgi:hypothetical protein